MGLCKDCKYWRRLPFEYFNRGVCAFISARNEASGLGEDRNLFTNANAMDEQGFWAGALHTDGDFGCNQFEEKTR